MKTAALISIFVLFCPWGKVALAKTLSCPALSEKIDDTETQLAELVRVREELGAKFKDLVVDDVKAQADGILNEVQNNEAIKVSYTKRKLTKSIDEKNAQMKTYKDDYCVRCATSIKNEFAKASFCAKCPGKIDCSDVAPPKDG